MLVLLCFRVAAVFFSVNKDLYKTRRAMDVAPTASRNFCGVICREVEEAFGSRPWRVTDLRDV